MYEKNSIFHFSFSYIFFLFFCFFNGKFVSLIFTSPGEFVRSLQYFSFEIKYLDGPLREVEYRMFTQNDAHSKQNGIIIM